jgi:hypothetical protein
MFFRGRGTTYLSERNDEAVTSEALAICQDALAIAMATEAGEHINKCGLIDGPDLRFNKGTTGTVTLTYSDVEDKKFAIGVLGTVVPAQPPGTVEDEVLPDNLVDGSVYWVGGLARHRNITGLTITDSATTPSAPLVLDTNYTLDPVSGKLTFLDIMDSADDYNQPFIISYGHTDPQQVSLLSAGQKNYYLNFEFFNVVNDGDPGTLEVYSVRFDPAQNVDFLSDDLQVMELVGTMLIDPSKPVDPVLGQFGRRIL